MRVQLHAGDSPETMKVVLRINVNSREASRIGEVLTELGWEEEGAEFDELAEHLHKTEFLLGMRGDR